MSGNWNRPTTEQRRANDPSVLSHGLTTAPGWPRSSANSTAAHTPNLIAAAPTGDRRTDIPNCADGKAATPTAPAGFRQLHDRVPHVTRAPVPADELDAVLAAHTAAPPPPPRCGVQRRAATRSR